MQRIGNISIKGKIILLILSVTYGTMILWSVFVLFQHSNETKKTFNQSMQMNAKIIADYVVGPISFNDTIETKNILKRINSIPSIIGIAAYGTNKQLITNYILNEHKPNITYSYNIEKTTIEDQANIKSFVGEIVYDNIHYGTIILHANTTEIQDQIQNYAKTLLFFIFLLGILAYLAALYMQKIISKPIQDLASVSRQISENNDFSLRVHRSTQDEITELYNAFNNMLAQIESRDRIRTEYEIQLTKAKTKAEEADKLKTSFLTNMSHELRTPMNAILGFSSLLLEEETPCGQYKSFIEIINESGNTLLNLVDDILDISKIEAGQIDIKKEDTNIHRLLEELLLSFNEIKHQKKAGEIALFLENNRNCKNLILTDPYRLRQILMNLLGNALKFTDVGNISFGIESITKQKVTFYVTDTGIGISSEQIPLIFERFRKIDNEKNRLFRGAGLGLAITKKLVELLDGEIWLESQLGIGSTFRFSIPNVISDSKEITNNLVKRSFADTTKRLNILIAEDESNNYKYLYQLLFKYNVNISWAKNGQEAINLCNIKDFDVILMDIKMPIVDGYKATKIIKATFPTIKIIAQTAYAGKTELEKVLEAGCDDYIVKPINPNKLISKLFSN
ncbi:MAG: ATP-binding protein [Salinivirgaceae bacterium]|nr:ATP-binding protein [Salinivirgaceae bacterium]MDD4746113.1 ATP-binding protein [Salinivirgaceae bacterium]